jgi:hypothetical protein
LLVKINSIATVKKAERAPRNRAATIQYNGSGCFLSLAKKNNNQIKIGPVAIIIGIKYCCNNRVNICVIYN